MELSNRLLVAILAALKNRRRKTSGHSHNPKEKVMSSLNGLLKFLLGQIKPEKPHPLTQNK